MKFMKISRNILTLIFSCFSGDKKLVDAINLDLLSAVAPTPKSLYRTSGAAHRNYGYTSHNLDPIDIKSKRV